MIEPLTFADRLDLLLDREGFTRSNLSRELGIPMVTIAMWKSRGNMPRPSTLARIAEFLGVSMSELLSFGEDEKSQRLMKLEREAETLLAIARSDPTGVRSQTKRLAFVLENLGRPVAELPTTIDDLLYMYEERIHRSSSFLGSGTKQGVRDYFEDWASRNREFLNLCMNLTAVELAEVTVTASRVFQKQRRVNPKRELLDIVISSDDNSWTRRS